MTPIGGLMAYLKPLGTSMLLPTSQVLSHTSYGVVAAI